uniref:cDNA FLJ52630 n=1 Tax=Homo sapiens TaxID=9606 RepID=B7Z4D1_HUMAN|nr:unnamed protein product [Homo sapiens]
MAPGPRNYISQKTAAVPRSSGSFLRSHKRFPPRHGQPLLVPRKCSPLLAKGLLSSQTLPLCCSPSGLFFFFFGTHLPKTITHKTPCGPTVTTVVRQPRAFPGNARGHVSVTLMAVLTCVTPLEGLGNTELE